VRDELHHQVVAELDIPGQRFDGADVRQAVVAIDRVFLDGELVDRGWTGPARLTTRASARMTRAAGMLRTGGRGPAELVISRKLIGLGKGKVGGRSCTSPADILVRVVEHELCHLMVAVEGVREPAHGPRFRDLLGGVFGHQSIRHTLGQLPEPKVVVGQRVVFEYRGQAHRGVVTRITKRATVIVDHPLPAKMYVPLSLLSAG